MKPKKYLIGLFAALALFFAVPVVMHTGCATKGPEQLAYHSIYSVETGTTAAVDAFFSAVLQGKAKTNGVPTVAKAYDEFQAAVRTAIVISQGNTNAPAPSSVIAAQGNVLKAINSSK